MMLEELSPGFEKYWRELSFQLPTPIQESVFQPLKNGEDVLGLSPTGTGKTLAYALPLLEKLKADNTLQLVVLTPSQELAHQVGRVMDEWGSLKQLNVQIIIGGANVSRQIEKLREKPEIVVGTPGRLLELANQKKLKLHAVRAAVLDEADFLLHPEHLNEVRELAKKMPGQRQLAFFSATSSGELENVSSYFNTSPRRFDVTASGSLQDRTRHAYLEVPVRKRADALRRLAHVKGMQALVFVNTTQELDYLAEKMQFEGISVRMLHSEYGKAQRRHALDEFRSGNAVFLLTTDVMARGMDIVDLPYVIHYDLPLSKETYLHRAGRTGRMGKEGTVLSLVNERDLRDLKRLVPNADALKEVFLYRGELVEERPVSDPDDHPAAKPKPVQKAKPPVEPQRPSAAEKKKKKKIRTKDRKNKGAPKKRV